MPRGERDMTNGGAICDRDSDADNREEQRKTGEWHTTRRELKAASEHAAREKIVKTKEAKLKRRKNTDKRRREGEK